MDKEIRKGGYKLRDEIINMEIKNKIVGIIGFGRIGKALFKKLKAFEVKFIVYDPYIESSSLINTEIKFVDDLNKLYSDSDIITVNVPLNKETKEMIGSADFKKMKKNAFFINTSRGQVVNEDHLYKALKSGEIKCAAIDVFDKEPPSKDNPLFELCNVTLSPHNAALTEDSLKKMATHTAQGILDFLNGKKPKYLVNPRILESKLWKEKIQL